MVHPLSDWWRAAARVIGRARSETGGAAKGIKDRHSPTTHNGSEP
ncbi:MAG TPA: hypothetical protein VJM09_13430 [Sphingobium sp.]|nr:hypothetical protein [Sphingobium sp.]